MSAITYEHGTARGTVKVPTEQVGSMSVALQLNGATIVRVQHLEDES